MRSPSLPSGDDGGAAPSPRPRPLQTTLARLEGRWLPPARVTWLAVAAIGGYGVSVLPGHLGLTSLVLLPLVAALADLLFQRVRFDHLRFPDAALATGFFLAVLLPPTALAFDAGLVAFAAVVVRHAVRYQGRPWFNPAAAGMVVGALALGLSPAWWVAIGNSGELLMLLLGVLVVTRSRAAWRIPVTFLLAFGGLATLYHFAFGGATSPTVLALSVLDPSTLFFALFMVTEPRSAPSDPAAQPLYGGLVAVFGVFAPLLFPTLGIFVGLLAGNLVAVLLRRRPAPERATSSASRTSRERRAAHRWGWDRRFAAVFFLFVLLGVVASSAQIGSTPPILVVSTGPPTSSSGGGSGSSACAQDASGIPQSTLSSLHQALGPSVILSYDSNTGVVVFYDPVNHVTVRETDLYEDYGYAEFNGDDFTVSGCAG